MKQKPAIIAYDIAANHTRRQVLNILREWRLDGQKSVHECYLTATAAEELFLQLGQIMHASNDRLLLAWLHTRRAGAARGCGQLQHNRLLLNPE